MHLEIRGFIREDKFRIALSQSRSGKVATVVGVLDLEKPPVTWMGKKLNMATVVVGSIPQTTNGREIFGTILSIT